VRGKSTKIQPQGLNCLISSNSAFSFSVSGPPFGGLLLLFGSAAAAAKIASPSSIS